MMCADVMTRMGFSCAELSETMLRVWSPFTYGDDGEVVGLYVEKIRNGYRVTDGAESLRHASSLGIRLNKKRLEALRKASSSGALVSSGGEISAIADESNLTDAIAAVLNAALVVSHFEAQWLPRYSSDTFTAEVGEKLHESMPDRVHRNVTVAGASGHQIEIPFSVSSAARETYIQPVAYGDGRVNWDYVYRGFGKMMDLKNIGASDQQRIIIVDDRDAQDDLGQAITLLSTSANVVRFKSIDDWIRRVA